MKQVGSISSIMRYPVKSMAGEQLEHAFVGFAGILGDRAYGFVRKSGVTGFPWLTIREMEDLVLYKARYADATAMAEPVDLAASLALAPGVEPLYPPTEAYAVTVETPDGKVFSVGSSELKEHLENEIDDALTLRFSERSLTDCRPLSIFSPASARALEAELETPIDPSRFRANFYVDWTVATAYYENALIGSVLQIGDRLKIMLTERDPRCKIITIDPRSGDENARILRHVASAHQGTMGVYGAVLLEGVVKSGDPIYLL